MKEGWEIKKLGEVCKIQTGKLDANAKVDDGEYPFFTCDSKPYRIDKFAFDDEAILISGNGSLVGHVDYYKGKFNAYQRTYVLTRFNSYYLPFLVHYLKNFLRSYIYANKKGGCIPYITLPILQNFQIPYPPLEEQERIVEELDCLSGVIEKKKQQLKELDALAQSIFYEMFGNPLENERGWAVTVLGAISIKIENGYNAKLEKDTYKAEGIPYFRCQNIWWNNIDYSDMVYIDEMTNEKMKSSSLMKNDLVISKIGRTYTENSSLGRTAIYEGEDNKANISGNLCFVRLNDSVVPKFVLYILTLKEYREWAKINTPGGIDKRAMSVSQISNFPIILPTYSLQQQFAEKIEKIEKQKELIRKSIEEVEMLFNSRMEYYFN
jgi:restriction endonuclease S subunit